MTICEVYVGDLKDPTFKWRGGNWNGNIPARLSPIFPPLPGNYNRTYEAWVTWGACGEGDEVTNHSLHHPKLPKRMLTRGTGAHQRFEQFREHLRRGSALCAGGNRVVAQALVVYTTDTTAQD